MTCSRNLFLLCALAGVVATACVSVAAAQESPPQPTQSVLPEPEAEGSGESPEAEHNADWSLEHLDTLILAGKYAEAVEVGRRNLAALDAAGRGESIETASSLDRLAKALLKNGEGTGDEAFEVAQRALSLKKSLLGDQHPETARSLQGLGDIQLVRMDVGSLDSFRQALQVYESALGPDSPEAAEAKFSMAKSIYFDEGDYETARKLLEEVLDLRERILGPEDRAVGSTLYMLGGAYGALGRFADGKAAAGRAVMIYRQALGSDHPDVVLALVALGASAQQCNDLAEARAAFEEAVAIAGKTAGSGSVDAGVALSYLSGVLREVGDYPAALDAAERGYRIQLQRFGPDHDSSLGALARVAILHDDLGDAGRSAELEQEIVRRTESVYGADHPNLATALNNLGVTLAFSLGRVEEAKLVLERALEIREKAFGPTNEWVATTLVNLSGGVYGSLGQLALARDYALRALNIREALASPPLSIASASYHVAEAFRRLGDTSTAFAYSVRALQIRQQVLGEAHPAVAEAHLSLARTLVADGQFEAGLAAALEGEQIARHHLVLLVRALSERQGLSYQSRRESGLGLLMTLATRPMELSERDVGRILDSVVRSRGLVFDEVARRRRTAVRSEEPDIRLLNDKVSETSQRLVQLVVGGMEGGDPEDYARDIEAARQDKESAERSLAMRSRDFSAVLAEGKAGLAEIVERLPEQSALVSFVRFDRFDPARAGTNEGIPVVAGGPEYVAFATMAGGAAPVAIRLGDADRIDRLVGELRLNVAQETLSGGRASAASELGYLRIAGELRARVWDPVAATLHGVKEIFIVPDGALHLVDFAALPAEDGQYLAEILPPLHYLPTERDLLMDSPLAAGNRLLALGAPDFDGTVLFAALQSDPLQPTTAAISGMSPVYRGSRSACGSFQAMAFEPLPGAFVEVLEVSELWRDAGREHNAVVLSGAEANETAFKQWAAGKRVLHLATHGFFLGGDCGSVLNSQETEDLTRENPLLLSGLVLAGANHRSAAGPDEDDGILTSEEIATLDLHDTEWAVLSACDTGRGEIRAGEGVFGLQRAFRLAGARTIIMSLWPVEDEAARHWMTALYRRHFAEGLSTMEAVHAANLELLQYRRAKGLSTHPFYWAGFVASGEWR